MTFLNRCLAGVITISTGLATNLPPTSTPGDAVTLKDQLDALLDAGVFDSTGTKIGAVRQVYVDDASGKITFATVSTGIFSSDAIVPLHGARLLDDELHVDHTRSVIRDSPRPDHTEDALTADQEVTLLEYYGLEAPVRAAVPAPAAPSRATPRATPPEPRDEKTTTSPPTPPVGGTRSPGEPGAGGAPGPVRPATPRAEATAPGEEDTGARDTDAKGPVARNTDTGAPVARNTGTETTGTGTTDPGTTGPADSRTEKPVAKSAGPTPDGTAEPTDGGDRGPEGGRGPAASPDRD